jgi:hypothetical protein
VLLKAKKKKKSQRPEPRAQRTELISKEDNKQVIISKKQVYVKQHPLLLK